MIDKILICGILSLAVWRISYMLVNEDGPFDIFERVRGLWLPLSVNPNSLKYFFYKLFSCIYCMSIWISLIVCALVFGIRSWLDMITVFAVSALALGYEEIIRWLEHRQ